ncbi:HlyD family type I secretion periplasmic adaptor subunit [Massilia violaceinigra]|uniref:Membrane fusion protein (MFP) family protein n=1 Tax=Massilia violaceinigra TaxID=2045208 RepID=A0ABY4A8P1_9BURK|nr:HlyD family type I secretion periplasmic adaptor subunit [Massilia violaceinigra]UOD31174.1 HlyD family type I secretion periplasmic adaptor subunit [Massilia violaceinigra]
MSNIQTRNITDVVARDVEPEVASVDSGKYSRLGWIIVLVGVVGFILWASFAPLDRGVPMSGTVATETSRKTVQHLTGGIVEDILVKDGDVVKAGQVLVRINPTVARSAIEMTRAQYFGALAAEARLQAERGGKSQPTFPKELLEHKDDPRAREAMEAQTQLMASRQTSLKNELAALEENAAGLKAQTKGLQESMASKKSQGVIIKEQLEGMRELAKDGYIPRSRLLEMERTFMSVQGTISEDIGNISRAQNQLMELSLRRIVRTQEYQKEVGTQLADVQKETSALASRMLAQDFELANAEVKAPVNGVVVGLQIFTKGGVIGPGARMMDIVPSSDAMVVEGQLAVNLIDKVQVGLPVEFIFSAFNTNKTPHIPGIVTQVSADRTVDERTGMPYYKIKARVTPEGAKLIASHKLDIQSGMPAELFIKTGERTMMNYLFKPVFDRAKTSLSED